MQVSKYLKKWFPLFGLPTSLAFIMAFIVPFFMGLYLSFTKFQVITDARWVGVQNYLDVLNGSTGFLGALWFSVRFTVVSVVLVNVVSFALAMILTRALKGTNFFRSVFFLPNLIGGIVAGTVWQTLINAILGRLVQQDLTYNSAYGFWGLVVMVNWQMIGYMMIIYVAAIQNISADVMEAADIDGASFWPKLFQVTIPMVASSITIVVFLTMANCLKLFDQNLALTNGAPKNATEGLALNIFRTFYFQNNKQGGGQAAAVIFFVFVAVIAVLQMRSTRSRELDA